MANDNQQISDIEETLREKVEALRKNEAQIPKEELETKYANAYRKQITQIEDLSLQVFTRRVAYVLVPKEYGEELTDLIRRRYSECSVALMEAIRKDYSVDNFIKIADQIAAEVLKKIFAIPNEAWGGKELYDINPWCSKPRIFTQKN